MLCRADGIILDGLWDVAITPGDAATMPAAFADKILVPFSVGSPLSRVSRRPGAHEAIWYRRRFEVPPNWDVRSRHIWLNFNAVDGNTIVFVNQKEIGRHNGGDAFSLDVTSALNNNAVGRQELAVEVLGSSAGCDGIWQTVWLAPLPPDHIDRLSASLSSTDGNLRLTAICSGDVSTQQIEVVISDAGAEVARGIGKPGEGINLSIHEPKLWSPENPFLYDVHVELRRDKRRLDDVTSCFGIRSIGVGKDQSDMPRILLNGVGFEGIYLFKHQGRYYWASTDNSLPDRDYDCFVAFSDTIEGPYRCRQLAIPHGGHNMFFADKRGDWWSTMFGGDPYAPVIQKPGLIRIEFAPDGTIHPKLGESD